MVVAAVAVAAIVVEESLAVEAGSIVVAEERSADHKAMVVRVAIETVAEVAIVVAEEKVAGEVYLLVKMTAIPGLKDTRVEVVVVTIVTVGLAEGIVAVSDLVVAAIADIVLANCS